MPRRGILIMTDGTPHDWFQNGKVFSLHLTLDDATGEILSGWFLQTECILGYCYAFKIMFEKHGPQYIYADRTSILWTKTENSQTSVARMLDELGIELIFADSPEAKGKIEHMNKTLQGRLLLNDIKRFNIKTYEELNLWFNKYYIKYINNKFAYEPKEKETEFIPLGKTDLSKIMCIKEERTILNGNMFSYKNHFYIPINKDNSDYVFYKGTKIEVWEDVFNGNIRVYKNKTLYNTKEIEGHYQDPVKKEQKRIQDQKML